MVRNSRRAAAIASIVTLLVVASPILREPWNDGFPLSPYAMFAFARPTKLTMDYGLGETATGERRYLTPRIVGSGEVLQALNVIARARQARQLPQLCETIAARVATLDRYKDVVTIKIVSGTHDAVEFLVRDQIGKEVERTRCPVKR
ncbi:MAG: hypothetical protein AB7T06_12565 [Kofleriaceae bacterium]